MEHRLDLLVDEVRVGVSTEQELNGGRLLRQDGEVQRRVGKTVDGVDGWTGRAGMSEHGRGWESGGERAGEGVGERG